MDWVWTDTTLSLSNWMCVEDIYANIFIIKCSRETEKVPGPKAGSSEGTRVTPHWGRWVLQEPDRAGNPSPGSQLTFPGDQKTTRGQRAFLELFLVARQDCLELGPVRGKQLAEWPEQMPSGRGLAIMLAEFLFFFFF